MIINHFKVRKSRERSEFFVMMAIKIIILSLSTFWPATYQSFVSFKNEFIPSLWSLLCCCHLLRWFFSLWIKCEELFSSIFLYFHWIFLFSFFFFIFILFLMLSFFWDEWRANLSKLKIIVDSFIVRFFLDFCMKLNEEIFLWK